MNNLTDNYYLTTGSGLAFPLYKMYRQDPSTSSFLQFLRSTSVCQGEIRALCEDIHEIIISTRRFWNEVIEHDHEYSYSDPPAVHPISQKGVNVKIVSKRKGELDFSFLDEYDELFD